MMTVRGIITIMIWLMPTPQSWRVCYLIQGLLMAAVMVIFPIIAYFLAGGFTPIWQN